jgi:LuxR family quorum-sensing system transcriptional regulator SolR
MDGWQENLVHSSLYVQNEDELFASLLQATQKLGFEHCAYGMRTPLPISSPRIYMLNNYPAIWQRHYAQHNYLACDPTVAHALHSPSALIWTENLFASCRPLWEDARIHGLRIGWAQPCHGPHGIVGLITLARSHDDLSPHELCAISRDMYWLAQLAHQGMSRLLTAKLLPDTAIMLSAREIEVLRWTSDGKTSCEISGILNISERTVNFHVNNAMEKLGTTNKTAAAVKAAILGML